MTRQCGRCRRHLSKQRHNAAKKYCYSCELEVRRERAERAHEARVSRVYGVPVGSYKRLYEAQDGRCYICRRATGKTRRLAVDHDHKTGKVRGLLCGTCNKMLGHARDDPSFFGWAMAYLHWPPAEGVIYGASETVNP